MTEYATIKSEFNDEAQEIAFAKRRCFLCIPCFKRSGSGNSIWWQRIKPTQTETRRRWWCKGFNFKAVKKVREWSELVAGPKWKTFIRRFNRNRSKQQQGKFNYDPLSYSLNFDEGPAIDEVDDDRLYRDFSTRYASIPVSVNSSMDFQEDDGFREFRGNYLSKCCY